MVAPLVLAGIGAGASVIGGLLGEWWSSADEEERQRLMEAAADEYGNVSAPALERLIAEQVNGSALEGMRDDYGNKGSRNAAIQALMNEGLSGGNTLETQLAQANAQRAAGQASRAGSQAALQSAAARGMGGGASALQAQLLSASQGADRAAQVGLQGAADARRNALSALAQGGGMAGQAEQADADSDARRREAMDRIALFNAGQRADTNRYNAGLAQQNFQNQMAVADRRAQANMMRADQRGSAAQRKRGIAGGIGQAGNQFATTWAMGGGK
jgi:hypothetical protein